MDNQRVTYIIATYNRIEDLKQAVDSVLMQKYENKEIIIISNSTDGTRKLFEDNGKYNQDCIRFFQFKQRMGVAGARNLGIKKSTGEIIITLDDDAELIRRDTTQKIVDEFESNPELGAIAFKGISPSGDTPQHWVPLMGHKSDQTPMSTSYFIGFGNAIRKVVFNKVGVYPEEYKYGYEEIDLSLRILESGYNIRYIPSHVVLHKENPSGRISREEEQIEYIQNRISTAIKHLPITYVLGTIIYQTFNSMYKFSVESTFKSLFGLPFWELISKRDQIDSKTIDKVKSLDGPIFLYTLI